MSTHSSAPPSSPFRTASRSRHSVLVVEDEPGIRKLLSELLESFGLDVSVCADGEAAWERMQEQAPDMLITDWNLPGTSGPDLIRRIRLSEIFPALYVMMLTGRSAQSDLIEGLEAGADDFLAKPFDAGELRVRVRAGQRILHLRKQLIEQNRLLEASNREMERELRAAGNLQRALIQVGPTRVPGYEGSSVFRPYSQASGDMFGVLPLDERHAAVYMVDVCGHGAAAAMLAFAISRMLSHVPGQDTLVKRRIPQAPYYELRPPVQVLEGLRERFENHENSGLYFTLLYGLLDAGTGELEWVSAGHLPPVVLRGGRCITRHDQSSQTPIGLPIAPRGEVTSNRARLEPGDRVFFHSDGLVDLRDTEGNWLPENSLEAAIAQSAALPIGECVEQVVERLKRSAGPLADDVTLIGLQRN